GILIGVTSCALAILVFLHNRRQSLNQVWALFALSVAVWGAGAYMISRVQVVEEALLWWRLTHIGIILIPVFFVHFVYIFLDIKKRFGVYITYATGIFFLIANATPYFIFQMRYVFGQFYYDSPPGVLYTPFVIFFGLAIMYTVDLLVRKYNEVSTLKQNQIRYFLWAITIGFIGGGTSFLPVFNIDVYPFFNFTVALYPAIMSFAILKSGFFNIKVIITELLIIILSIILFVQIFFSVSQTDSIFRGMVFAFILGIGTWLILSVQKEVSQREKIEKLAGDLEESNKGQENLIHTLSHQVKGGLAQAGAAFAAILQGDYNDNPLKMTEMLKEALRLNKRDVASLEQTLLAFNPKLGTEAYEMQKFDFKDALLETVQNLQSEADGKKLAIALRINEKENYELTGDREKITSRVLHNLIANAIIYTPTGGFTVDLHKTDNKILLTIQDTGTGITPEDMRILFTRGGHGKDSLKVNAHSIGDGLYLAKVIVEKHGGRIWAESEGAGKGATFFVELPVKQD
ncbi:MAG: ATP-binding protein, partial [bacterium]|nr:ATP-binding protein [bacterium]